MPTSNESAQIISRIYETYGTNDYRSAWIARDAILWDMVGYGTANKYEFFATRSGQQDPTLLLTKKNEQSNLSTGNSIGGDYYYVIQSIRLYILNSAKNRQTGIAGTGATGVITDTLFSARQLAMARLITAIMSQGVLNFSVLDRSQYLENLPFQVFAPGFGLGDVVPPAVGFTDGDPVAINGGANALVTPSNWDVDGGMNTDVFRLPKPMVLAPSSEFRLPLEFPLGTGSPSPAAIYTSSADASAQPATMWLMCGLVGQKVRPRG